MSTPKRGEKVKTVTKIEANQRTTGSEKKLRVAAYCRVSTGSDDQLESLAEQKKHYETYIQAHENWDFAGLYYDEGISGTKKEKRSELMRLLSDCEAGQIDFIITKSISRFARNTTDCLEMVRKLLAINVAIYFEKENINTTSMESELVLAVLSSLAENESVSISGNEKWSIRQRFQSGTYKMNPPPYGYSWNGEQLEVNNNQAEIVKRIFAEFLSGKGVMHIARNLDSDNIVPARGKQWCQSSILRILKNENYTGNAVFQKTFTDESFRRCVNYGQLDKYLVADHHEGIISFCFDRQTLR